MRVLSSLSKRGSEAFECVSGPVLKIDIPNLSQVASYAKKYDFKKKNT